MGMLRGLVITITQVCVAALFYHMIAIDGVVTMDELERLRALLRQRYQLDDTQLAALTREGKDSDEDSAGLFPFTVILKSRNGSG